MNLLISGCLLGLRCRYDGACKPLPEPVLQALAKNFRLIPVCPEQLGGLPTPREPSERRGDGFFTRSGKDVTAQYQRGAREAEKLASFFNCKAALLKERSPACGFGQIYDGSFHGILTRGKGAAAELLENAGLQIFGESEISRLLEQVTQKP